MNFNRCFFGMVLVIVVFLAWSTNAYSADIVTDGLISSWTLDKSSISGKTVKDSWGNNDGTLIGNPQSVAGKINEALLFNGKDECVEIPNSESLSPKAAITIDFWFAKAGKTSDAQPYPRAVSKGQSTTTDGAYGIWVADQPTTLDIGFRYPDVGGVQRDFQTEALPDYSDGSWHHVAVTYNGEEGIIYFDGEVAADVQKSGDLAQTEDPLHIGDGNNQRHFNGVIDEVHIYDRALDAGEILTNFNAKSNIVASVTPGSKISVFWGSIKAQ